MSRDLHQNSKNCSLCWRYENEYWGNITHHSGHPVGSTALVAASVPTGSWGCEPGERLQGVYWEAPETRPVWADSSVQAQEKKTKLFSFDC